ncbi:MAG: 50S ribosomal protein L11 methyltransferase [Lachnospiraceae bacterium]|nr:50S ribosomal protein L11 methyltransferase [Lachnospiraceae bacterium]
MKWIKYRIKTVTEAEDILISNLYDIGLEGAQIEDKVPLTALEKEQMFVDILPEVENDDDVAYLSCFVEASDEVNKEEILENIKAVLEETKEYMEIGEGSVEVSETEDVDWINNWKQYFHQFYIDDLLVIPSWEEVKPEDKDKKILHIDPGTAFGTGMHETTQLCIRSIKKYLTPETVLLDVGTGSGILSIVSLMYGAKSAVGTDLDPCAPPACYENMEVNGVDTSKFKVMIGNIISDKAVQDEVGYGCYDIVVANILADVLEPLTPVIINQMKPGAVYITSGIINTKEEEVADCIRSNGLEILHIDHQGEWVGITARKNA